MRAFLEAQGHWSEAAEQSLRRECSEAVEAAVKQYLATPKQSTDSMFDYLYAQLPPGLRAQREDARRYAALRP
jgi:pyruvate dehydrogenase E1 component alpha subunit